MSAATSATVVALAAALSRPTDLPKLSRADGLRGSRDLEASQVRRQFRHVLMSLGRILAQRLSVPIDSAAGRSGRILAIVSGCACRTASSTSIGVSPANAVRPVAIS